MELGYLAAPEHGADLFTLQALTSDARDNAELPLRSLTGSAQSESEAVLSELRSLVQEMRAEVQVLRSDLRSLRSQVQDQDTLR